LATAIGRVGEIFADVRLLHDSAVRKFEEGDIRGAAEKAWCPAKSAADALILGDTSGTRNLLPEYPERIS
jgi:hypothetical protein